MIRDTQETSNETVAGSAISALTICQQAHKPMLLFYNHFWLFYKKFHFFDLFFLFPSVFAVKSKTGALEGPEVDGFVKDMMGLVRVSSLRCETIVCLYMFKLVISLLLQPNMTGSELDQLRAIMLRHCDVNKDGKIQRNELALCLGVKP